MRLHLEQLPPCAPDLNPVEGLWHYRKRVNVNPVTPIVTAVRDLANFGEVSVDRYLLPIDVLL